MRALTVIAIITGILFFLFLIQTKSRKSFITNLLKQVIYLIPRYFV